MTSKVALELSVGMNSTERSAVYRGAFVAPERELGRKDEMQNSWEQLSPHPDVAGDDAEVPAGPENGEDESRPLLSMKIEARRKGNCHVACCMRAWDECITWSSCVHVRDHRRQGPLIGVNGRNRVRIRFVLNNLSKTCSVITLLPYSHLYVALP